MNINAVFSKKSNKKRNGKVKQITFKQYKAIDISLLTALLFIFEALSTYATIHWFSLQALALSVTPLILAIVMLRWGWPAVISALLGGVAYCIAGGANLQQYAIYCIGNTAALLSLLVIKAFGKDEIRKSKLKLIIYAISTYLFICIGRWLVSLVFEPTIKTLLAFITTDVISLVISLVGLLSLRNNDGMLEDQKAYLLRLDRELREEQNATAPTPYTPDYDESEYDDLDDIIDGIPEDDDLDGIIDTSGGIPEENDCIHGITDTPDCSEENNDTKSGEAIDRPADVKDIHESAALDDTCDTNGIDTKSDSDTEASPDRDGQNEKNI